jgi:hypothetical protein
VNRVEWPMMGSARASLWTRSSWARDFAFRSLAAARSRRARLIGPPKEMGVVEKGDTWKDLGVICRIQGGDIDNDCRALVRPREVAMTLGRKSSKSQFFENHISTKGVQLGVDRLIHNCTIAPISSMLCYCIPTDISVCPVYNAPS